jgi:hypothetical protein
MYFNIKDQLLFIYSALITYVKKNENAMQQYTNYLET